jgi:hypothetical protein
LEAELEESRRKVEEQNNKEKEANFEMRHSMLSDTDFGK